MKTLGLAVVAGALVAAAFLTVRLVVGAVTAPAAATGAATIWSQSSTTVTSGGMTGPLAVPSGKRNLTLGDHVTAITASPQSKGSSLRVDYLGADGAWYPVGGANLPSKEVPGFRLIGFGPGSQISTSIGQEDTVPTNMVRVRWILEQGTASLTFSGFLIGR